MNKGGGMEGGEGMGGKTGGDKEVVGGNTISTMQRCNNFTY